MNGGYSMDYFDGFAMYPQVDERGYEEDWWNAYDDMDILEERMRPDWNDIH